MPSGFQSGLRWRFGPIASEFRHARQNHPVDVPSAYAYPLLIKQLLHTPLATTPSRKSPTKDSYRTLSERIGRLASGLAGLGIEAGQTVAVMDWDSHRYLECFAVPMIRETRCRR